MSAAFDPNMFSTSCKICRKEIAQAPALNMPLTGLPDIAGLQYLQLLSKHMNKRHSDHAHAFEGAVQEFGAMLLTTKYEIEDPSVTKRAELIRSVFVSQFAFHSTDEEIAALVARFAEDARFGMPESTAAQLTELICELRDLWTCRGKYAPKTDDAEPKLIVVP